MTFLLISGIVIGLIIIQSLLGKYKDIVNIACVVVFIIWQFNLSSDNESNIRNDINKEKVNKLENKKTNSLNSYDSQYLNSNKENSTYSNKKYLEYKKKREYNSNRFSNYNDSKKIEVRVGAVCNDGTTSTATGNGACSYHGGVAYWLVE